MSSAVYPEWQSDTPEPRLYLDRHGDLYPMPETRAELMRHLHFQRRLVAHLVAVIAYIGRGVR